MAKETIMLILKAAVAGRFCGKRAKLNVRFFRLVLSIGCRVALCLVFGGLP